MNLETPLQINFHLDLKAKHTQRHLCNSDIGAMLTREVHVI